MLREDVLKASIIFVGLQLLGDPTKREQFKGSLGSEVIEALSAGVSLGIDAQGISATLPPPPLVMNRERIALIANPGRTEVNRDYPETPEDLNRLAEITERAITLTDVRTQRLQSFGFNMEGVYRLPSGMTSGAFIADHIYAPGLFSGLDCVIEAGSPNIRLRRGPHIWNIRIEPRFGRIDTDHLFVSFNLHRDSSTVPTGDQMRRSLVEVWNQSQEFMDSFEV